MFNKLNRALGSTLLAFFIIASGVFSAVLPVYSAQLDSNSDGDNPMGIVIEETSGTQDNTNIAVEPDLGDDQAFPFIPGFGKNSGKD